MRHSNKILIHVVTSVLILTSTLTPFNEVFAEYSKNKPKTRDKTEIIVKYKDPSKAESVKSNVKSKLKLEKVTTKKKYKNKTKEVIEISNNDDMNKTIAELKSNPAVEYVQPNFKLATASVPQDARYSEQWALSNKAQTVNGQAGTSGIDIQAEAAWASTEGSSSVVVGVLDTGIDANHSDLQPNMYHNPGEKPGNGMDDDGNGYIDDTSGWDFANHDSSTYDGAEDKHGTSVAGVIAAAGDQAGIKGVAPEVSLLPLKFISNGTGYTSDAIEAIEYAKRMGVKVINASFGGPDNNLALQKAIEESGILFVSASGNNGQDTAKNPIYPASFGLPNVLSVAALNNQGLLASFSNYGGQVQVAAPGVSILSTVPENQYEYANGTSLSTAVVTGVAALIQSLYPDLTPQQIADRIKGSVSQLPKLKGLVSTQGMVNAAAALKNTNVSEPPVVQDNKPTETDKGSEGSSVVGVLDAAISPELLEEIHYGEVGVSVATGNFSTSAVDLYVDSPGIGISMNRIYNSKDEKSGKMLSRGWTFGYEGKVEKGVVKLPSGETHAFFTTSDAPDVYKSYNSHGALVKNKDNTFTFTNADQTVYEFNTAGLLASIKDKNGNTTTVELNLSGKVSKITDSASRTYTLSYNVANLLSSITDPMGRKVSYEYDGFNRLTKVIDPNGNVKAEYEYDGDNYLTVIKDGDNSVLEKLGYDTKVNGSIKKVVTHTDVFGKVDTYKIGTTSTTITDSTGRTITKKFDAQQYVKETIDPEGKSAKVEYNLTDGVNKFGEIKTITDRYGNKTEYTWSEQGNITKIVNPDASTSNYTYDTKNNLISEQDENGNMTYYVYDVGKSNLIKKARPLNGTDVYSEAADESKFAIQRFEYYSDNEASQLGYKGKGLLKMEADAAGNATVYTYDGYGNKASKKDGANNVTTYTNDMIGHVLKMVSPGGFITQYSYDSVGNMVKSVMAQGETTRILYDNQGRKVQEIQPNQYQVSSDGLNDASPSQTYRDGNTGLRTEYDPSGQIKKSTDAFGYASEYVYDMLGNLSSETKPNGSVYLYEYDNMKRKIREFFKASADAEPVLQKEFAYKALDNGTREESESRLLSDTEKATTTKIYDYAGQLIEQVNPDGSKITNTYYPNRIVKSTTNGAGGTTYYKYDVMKRQTDQWVQVDNASYMYSGITYDLAGHKQEDKQGKDNVALYSVPVKDRLIVKSYTYDGNGHPVSEMDSAGKKKYMQYDKDGFLIREELYTTESTSDVTEYVNNQRGKPLTKLLHVRAGDLDGHDMEDQTDVVLTTSYEYDSNGNLVKEIAPDGSAITNTYDALDRQTSVNKPGYDEFGNKVVISQSQTYNWKNNPSTKTDPNGNETTYEYNSKGLPTKIIDPQGGVTAFEYDRADRKIIEVSPANYDPSKPLTELNRTEYAYDGMDRVKAKFDKFNESYVDEKTFQWETRWGEKVSKAYQYDGNGKVTKELDGEGYKAGIGETIDAHIRSGYGKLYNNDLSGRIQTVIDPVSQERNGQFTTQYVYDGAGRQLLVIDSQGFVKGKYYDDAGREVAAFTRTSPNAPDQILKSSTYDLAGRLNSETDGNGNKFSYQNNAFGKPSITTLPGDETIGELRVEQQYDLFGNMVRQLDSMHRLILRTYDFERRVLTSTEQQQDGKDIITNSIGYDRNGNKRFEMDGNGNTTESTYNKLNKLLDKKISVTDLNGKKTTQSTKYSYDLNGNKTSEMDWLNNSQIFMYDPLNRLIEKRDAFGKTIQRVEYNASDAQIHAYDVYNEVTLFTYDRNNRLIKTTDPEGLTTEQDYAQDEQVSRKIDGRGNVTSYQYDPMGHVSKVTNPKGEVTAYSYDANGSMLAKVDGKGNTTIYEYNARNLLIRKIDDGGRTGNPSEYKYLDEKVESNIYSPNGLLLTKKDRNGNVTEYSYDIHGRKLSEIVTPSEKSSQQKEQKSYTYDNNGNPLSMSDITGTTFRTFDARNRVTSLSEPKVGTTTHLFDQVFGLTPGYVSEEMTDVKGNKTTKIYDKANRLVEVRADNNPTAVYVYNDNGSTKSVAYPNGSKEEYTYYKNNQLRTLLNYQGSSVLDSYSYTYDASYNQISKTEMMHGVNKGTTQFTYDSLNRLESVQEPDGKLTEYTYDASGNRVTEKVTAGTSVQTTTYAYNEQNRLLTTTEVSSSGQKNIVKFTWDFNGNMIGRMLEQHKKIDPLHPVQSSFGMFIMGQPLTNPKIADIVKGTASYEYDVWNQMSKSSAGEHIVTYEYNAEGYRVEKVDNGVATKFVYDQAKVILELDEQGKQTARNVQGNNLLMRQVDDESAYVLYNGHHDVTALVDSNGQVRATFDYDAFGTPIESMNKYFDANGNAATESSKIDSLHRYAEYQYDQETGLYYLNARYYDSKIARFITEDSYTGRVDDPLSLNLYTYVENSPLRYKDPTGHMKDSFGAALPMPTGDQNPASFIQTAQTNWWTAQEHINNIKAGNSTGLTCSGCDDVSTWEKYQESMHDWAEKIRSGSKVADSLSVKLEGSASMFVGGKLGVEVKGNTVKLYFTASAGGSVGASGGLMVNHTISSDLNGTMSPTTTNAGVSGGAILIGEFTYKSDQKYVELSQGIGLGGGVSLDVIPLGTSFEKEYSTTYDLPFNATPDENIIIYPAYNGAPSYAEFANMFGGKGW
ncbi:MULTISPECIES: S8 family serine peptidase [Paenibacillus]|uniref:S8 family serine peptidase n=1 Tax=Paenibacillus TaxID=44249 RepID=UPI0022B88B2F|nr:S8 family serine peptidase [Paenibacillus caseinilyticus]MCZ8518602.1 S8 family serine peptidase [Paenibacillus caseinilyticus]